MLGSITLLASSPDPYPAYADLRRHGPRRSPDGWVVARPADVVAALAHPALSTDPGDRPGPRGGTRWWRARMARFSDGAAHARRRSATERVLAAPEVAALGRRARHLACVTGRAATDAMALASTVPATVMAEALGLDPATAVRAAGHARALAAALAPRLGPPDPAVAGAGDAAARALAAWFGPGEEAAAAAMAVLFQTQDATAGLAGNALVAWARDPAAGPDAEARVAAALRHDPPTHWTRRTATGAVTLAGEPVAAGATVWLLLAGGGDALTNFGSGPHACPAGRLAPALAAGVVAGIADRGLVPDLAGPPAYEPRPNLRIPATVPLRPTPGRARPSLRSP